MLDNFLKADSAISALQAIGKTLGLPISINFSYKKYRYEQQVCRINLGTKSFTETGESCFIDCSKKVVIYVVQTYAAFESMKEEVLETINKPLPCKIDTIENIIPQKLL